MGKIIRRYKRTIDEMSLEFSSVSRARCFGFRIPDGIPYDHEDSEAIEKEIWALTPSPKELQCPVPDGLGGLVYDGFQATYWDDDRPDDEIMFDLLDAVRRGLRQRAFRER